MRALYKLKESSKRGFQMPIKQREKQNAKQVQRL